MALFAGIQNAIASSNDISNFWEGLGRFATGFASSAAGSLAGIGMSGAFKGLNLGGIFIGGAVGGMASSAIQGQNLSGIMKGGLMGGLSAAANATAQASHSGANLWTGEFDSSIGASDHLSGEEHQSTIELGQAYNNDTFRKEIDKNYLQQKVKENYGISEGDWGLTELTSFPNRLSPQEIPYGMTPKGDVVLGDGTVAKGFVTGNIYSRDSKMCIGPGTIWSKNVVDFDAVVIHELYHVYQNYNVPRTLGDKKHREAASYNATYRTYSINGYEGKANMYKESGMSTYGLDIWDFPSKYKAPLPIKHYPVNTNYKPVY